MSSEAARGRVTAKDGMGLPDAEVVHRVRAGEAALFEILMRRYNQRIYRAARAIVKDEDEAEDVMQQAYVNAFQHLDQFADRASFATWLTRIAVHEALARLRRRGRVVEMETMGTDDGGPEILTSREPGPEQLVLTAELRRTLEESLDTLPEIYRVVFVFREVEGLTTAETAECLGTSEDVVKTRLHRARALLQCELLARAGAGARDAFTFRAVRCDRVVGAVLARIHPPLPPGIH
jgi:RNA polymerase sigma-70 factor (ECF subfamily)